MKLVEMKPKERYPEGKNHWLGLIYLPDAKLEQIFKSVKKWEDRNKNHEPQPDLKTQLNQEIYLSVRAKTYNSFAVTVTNEFKKWLEKHGTFYDLHINFELVRQYRYNLETKESTYENNWLLLFSYSEIIGSTFLRYYSSEEIEKFFGKLE